MYASEDKNERLELTKNAIQYLNYLQINVPINYQILTDYTHCIIDETIKKYNLDKSKVNPIIEKVI